MKTGIKRILVIIALNVLFANAYTAAAQALGLYNEIGAVNYSGSAQALDELWTFVAACMSSVGFILAAIAVLCGLYNAMVIYIKMSQGEQGVGKSIVMFVGSIIFIIASMAFVQNIFGYNLPVDFDFGPFNFLFGG